MILIDNYDSFTYNIVQYLQELGCRVDVYENDTITVEELKQKSLKALSLHPDLVILTVQEFHWM